MKICLKGGLLINPITNLEKITDIYIKDGIIVFIGENNLLDDYEIIDVTSKWVVPGFIDLHVHLRDPGYDYKETIESGSLAAAKGGFTTICAMPNTKPVIDNAELVNYVAKKSNNGVNVLPIGAITKNLDGLELTNIKSMIDSGICAISDDGKTVMNSSLMKQALIQASQFNLPIFAHTEDMNLIGGVINEGQTSIATNLPALGREAEEIIIARDMILAKYSNAHIHICHVSTKGSTELIQFAKNWGVNITAETAPHYFSLDDSLLLDLNPNKKMNPPLRSKDDVLAIRQALKNGTIDCIATDHAPHSISEKSMPIESAPFGVVGLETSFSISYTYLVKSGILTPMELIKKMSANPANIINIDKGNIDIGKIADITILDVNKKYKINATDFVSKSQNTPFNDLEVYGIIEKTLVNGNVIYENSTCCN
ncbi:MAG: dihydroorotase [Candidatus Epulonipiscioides saccharophilum]|nr:MAG: dihydroorotase [Epulopiscium sp. AS2M-Bin001]